MSKSTIRWRQAGFTAVATALVVGGTLVGAGAANAAAAATLTATSTPPAPSVGQGEPSAAAGNLTYAFDNAFADNTTISFTIAGNVCTTTPGLAAAVGFDTTQPPTVGTFTSDSAVPGISAVVLSKSNAACADNDIATVTLTDPSVVGSDPTDRLALTLTNFNYNVGASTPLGNVTVNATSVLGNDSAVNAVVAGTTLSIDAPTAAAPGATNVALGTVTIADSAPATSFSAQGGATVPVSLTLDGDNGDQTVFNVDALATVTPSAGYTITNRHYTGTSSFDFNVNTPADNDANPLTNPLAAATITVAGLHVDNTDVNTFEQVSLTTNLDTVPDPIKVLNVMNFTFRTGGDDRYSTAAQLYSNKFGTGTIFNPTDVVLSSGVAAPDALSANYLAGNKGTGTLLTRQGSLPAATYNAIIAKRVGTVYITGETNAVSQAVENKIEATTVGGSPFGAKINVVRLGGDDRYATNRLINSSVSSTSDTVLVATGEDFADALALGPIANGEGFPLVLTKTGSLSPDASAQLDSMSPARVVIAGGTSAVSQSVADAIAAKGITVLRVQGTDRTETAGQIAQWATDGLRTGTTGAAYLVHVSNYLGTSLNYVRNPINLATGSDFADALAAGPVAGANDEIILLSRNATTLGTGAGTYLGTKDVDQIGNVEGLGLQNALARSVLKAAAVSVQK